MVSVIFYVTSQLILSGLILNQGILALNNANCTAAMRSTDGGINSINANTGSPLLGIIGIVNSSWTLLCFVGALYLFAFNTGTYIFIKGQINGPI